MDSLPVQFVSSMKILFNILDDKHTGFVYLKDIKHRWRHDRTKDLPQGVIESLQKVASHDGTLTFENFCTGLKICLLHNQIEKAGNSRVKKLTNNSIVTSQQIKSQSSLAMLGSNVDKENIWEHIGNKSYQKQSICQQIPQNIKSEKNIDNFGDIKCEYFHETNCRGMSDMLENSSGLESEEKNVNIDPVDRHISLKEQNRGLADGKSALELQLETRRTRRLEPRRHTLHNGIDYNLLKRMKQIEQEKEILLLGLSAIEEARDWYLQQLAEVQEKMRYAGRMGVYMEPWSEAHQERLELLKVRVLEINRQLQALASGWRHGQLSLHMNLAVPSTLVNHSTLRSQNQLLHEELNKKNRRISVLESEKSTLIRKILIQRDKKSENDNNY